MIRIARNGIKTGILFLYIVLASNCKNYTFLPKGAVVSDSSYFVNDSLKLRIELPGDFYAYSKKKDNGIKTDHFYSGDKKILKELGYDPKNVSILFSGKPVVSPFYNLIALIKPGKTSTIDHADSVKKIKLNGKEIAVGIIPGTDYEINLIYYDTLGTSCSYCDIKEITANNKLKLTHAGTSEVPYNDFDICAGNPVKQITLPYPKVFGKRTAPRLVRVYKIDPADSTEVLSNFRLVNKTAPVPVVKLCPGKYRIKYTDKTYKTILDTTLNVN